MQIYSLKKNKLKEEEFVTNIENKSVKIQMSLHTVRKNVKTRKYKVIWNLSNKFKKKKKQSHPHVSFKANITISSYNE